MSNALHEISDEELARRFKEGTEYTYWTPEHCQRELERRANLKTATAMNRWTAIITIATIVNVLVAIIQALAAIGYFKN